ncbi:response regulator [Humisphaera borealis]|uniref:Response regulator n=1 Tax=Humisphaera borealis TaxID=2807512 RepID=A0A7M2X2N0_9BACT|nr:response regulator [Humisphaera borealis]QOV91945.1 response regulator [Humisphaera borealis]
MATVMVVEDADLVRETLTRLLRREGFEILAAHDGLEAMEMLRSTTPDVILLDVNMPDMDGIEMLEALQSSPQYQGVPVVMLTSHGDTHTIRRAMQLGAKEFLVKATFSIGEMLESVKRYASHQPN